GALQAAMDLDPLQLAANLHDAVANDAPVGLELGLARPPRADAAAETLEVAPLPHEPRQEIRELGELHLELALARARALREDVEDQRGAVDHLAPQRLGDVALLAGRQPVAGDEAGGVSGVRRPASVSATAAGCSAASTSIHSMSGSRVNHVHWRLA